jgi:hypothetical protein
MADEFPVYKGVCKAFGGHQVVHHGNKVYADGDISTNTAESSFALLKRGSMGIHLPFVDKNESSDGSVNPKMKTRKRRMEAAAKAAIAAAIDEAAGFKRPAKPPTERKAKGPEPERLKISGFRNWENAASAMVQAKKPPGGWPTQ